MIALKYLLLPACIVIDIAPWFLVGSWLIIGYGLVTHVNCGKTAERIEMKLGMMVALGQGRIVLGGAWSHTGKGTQPLQTCECLPYTHYCIDRDEILHRGWPWPRTNFSRLVTPLEGARQGPMFPNKRHVTQVLPSVLGHLVSIRHCTPGSSKVKSDGTINRWSMVAFV